MVVEIQFKRVFGILDFEDVAVRKIRPKTDPERKGVITLQTHRSLISKQKFGLYLKFMRGVCTVRACRWNVIPREVQTRH